MSAIKSNKGWIDTRIIVVVYVDEGGAADGWPVKVRCQPNPFAWNPTVATVPTRELAEKFADGMASALFGGPA